MFEKRVRRRDRKSEIKKMIKRRSDRKKVEREEDREERKKKRENRNLSFLLLHFPESLSSLPRHRRWLRAKPVQYRLC